MNASSVNWAAHGDEALRHLRRLLQFDTTNPPGAEMPAIEFLRDLLRAEGFEPVVLESAPGRGNLVARLKGSGKKPPLLLAGHVDVVGVDRSQWRHDPFAAALDEGHVWARGAIDMKNMVTMSLMTMLLLKRQQVALDRDVIFAAVADEEAGCDYGSRWLVETHPELVRAEFMLGEIGGFTMHVNGVRIYPIQVAEKGTVWMRMTARGEPGHGSMPYPDTAVVKLARAVEKLGRIRLPQHNTPVVERFLRDLAATQKPPVSLLLPLLLNSRVSSVLLDRVLPDKSQAAMFGAILHNTVSPTVLRGGDKTNVIPGRASCELDGRTLPGQSTADLLRELRAVTGDDVEIEVLHETAPAVNERDTDLFRHLCAMIRRHDPQGVPIANLVPGFTDAAWFSRLGATCYGFSPLLIPSDAPYTFGKLFHGHNERVPIDGFKWGVRVLYETVAEFCAAA